MEMEEIRVLRGVVYMTKSRGPRTEPWEHYKKKYARKRGCYDIKHERSEVGLEPTENRAMNTEPKLEASD